MTERGRLLPGIVELIWDDWNIEHIARHHVTPVEVDEVCRATPMITRARGGTVRVIGQTGAGRYLALFMARRGRDSYYAITARDSTEAERRLYRRWKGS